MSIAPASTIKTPPSPADSGVTLTVQQDEGARFPDAPFPRYTALIWPTNTVPQRGINAEEVTILDRDGDAFTFERGPVPVDITEGMSFALLNGEPIIHLLETYTLTYDFGEDDPPYRIDIRKPNGAVVTGEGTAYVTDNGSGSVSYQLTADVSGLWYSRFTTGEGAASPEASFYVLPSDVLDG